MASFSHGIEVFHGWNARASTDLARDKSQEVNKQKRYPARHTSFRTKVLNDTQSSSVHTVKNFKTTIQGPET